MTRFMTTTAALAALALTPACSGDQSAENNQMNVATEESAEANMAAADPNNPYAQAESQMGERMMAAVGQNTADTWVRKMIEHHRGAIEMSDILERSGGEPQVLDKARETAAAQRRELQELERMLQGGVSGNAPANPFEQMEHRSHQQMMAAVGTNPSETWLRKMIQHHRGGIEMSELVIAQGGNAEVAEMARRSAAAQRRDIEALEALLRGGDPSAAQTPAAATAAAPARETSRNTAAPAARQPGPAPKAASMPRATQRDQATPRPAPTPEPAPAPKETCAPEHRAAGHC